jgi:drug/metabolite transporter (DMT)-like permease
MEPVSAAVLAAVLLGERLTPAIVVGGAAIVAAGVVVALRTPGGGSVEEPVAGPPEGHPPSVRIPPART